MPSTQVDQPPRNGPMFLQRRSENRSGRIVWAEASAAERAARHTAAKIARKRFMRILLFGELLDDAEDFAVAGLDERDHFRVRILPAGVGHDSGLAALEIAEG